jgi:hypothetical protein
MKFRTLLLLVLLVISTTITAHAIDSEDINKKVVDINGQSLKLFGVSLNALFYLFDSANHYLLLCPLENSGNINYIRELENKGYVKAEIITGLPDGTEKNEKFLRFKIIGQGIEIQKSLIALGNKNIIIKSTGPGNAGR